MSARDGVPAPERVQQLLARADAELAAAVEAHDAGDRFVHAHLAALRAAAAVVAWHGDAPRRGRARPVWELLSGVEPELAAWSVYFASGARLRAVVDSGHGDEVPARRADELLACAEDFRDEVGLRLDPQAGFTLTGVHGPSTAAS
ncbi:MULTISPECIES: SAV_6107 family HEPN domain-containing protein [Isoptericola]|uniref:SAV_6107 family HEPN domain-containing protein n=1 Tax=Isoptericola haloaureus TaxID=1542902 RepID=A0ABU7Z5X4_9MICO|nr:SAV_6107 family HEPN domain-containing protein [Isoptericola sp. AK164]